MKFLKVKNLDGYHIINLEQIISITTTRCKNEKTRFNENQQTT